MSFFCNLYILPHRISGTGEAVHFKFGLRTDTDEYYSAGDVFMVMVTSRDLFNFG